MHHFSMRTPYKTRSRLKWKNSQRLLEQQCEYLTNGILFYITGRKSNEIACYECEFCGKEFKRNESRKKHMKKIHAEKGE